VQIRALIALLGQSLYCQARPSVKNVQSDLCNLKLEEIYATYVRLECSRASQEALPVVTALPVLFKPKLARVCAVCVLWGKYSAILDPKRV